MERVVNISKRHGRHFASCRFHTNGARLNGPLLQIKQALRAEKRDYDLTAADAEGHNCLVLLETERHGAKAMCDRLKGKLQAQVGLKTSYVLATFPDDGETIEPLVEEIAGRMNSGYEQSRVDC